MFPSKTTSFLLSFTLQTSTGTCARCKTLIFESQELDGGSDIGDKEFEWFRKFEFGPG